MKRQEYINKIVKYSAIFINEIDGFNALNQYDINMHAENFFIPVFNEIFGLSLENINLTHKKNFPAVDLADFKQRVTFQITSTNTSQKVYDTLKTFFDNDLQKYFDVIYIYIINNKAVKINENKINEIVPSEFIFSPNKNIIDNSELLRKINSLQSVAKIEYIAKIYEQEFSDVQLKLRRLTYQSGSLKNEAENIFPNLLGINFPTSLYKAQLNIDEESLSDELNQYLVGIGKRKFKKFRTEKLVKQALRKCHAKNDDWVLFEKWLYTFRNLLDTKEPLNKIVDVGTVTEIDCLDFYTANEDYERVFKNILRKTFGEFCKTKGIEWFGKKKLFRFANNYDKPSEKRVKWKGNKEATKTVIVAIRSKKDNHIICYRNLAFHCSFLQIDCKWYIVINPTWSFTNTYGFRQSRYEPHYMSGIKRMENNKSVYNYYRFFGYYLSYTDLFTKPYPFFRVHTISPLTLLPRIEELKWLPIKPPVIQNEILDSDIQIDNELFDESFFE
ncbi:MAG: SMEK domain-containing protein [Candidatus Methanofastidiosa archaeon]|nr:SMEK domain-containing protein [Candidatus Methanofastidiosa archaeon]